MCLSDSPVVQVLGPADYAARYCSIRNVWEHQIIEIDPALREKARVPRDPAHLGITRIFRVNGFAFQKISKILLPRSTT